MYNTFFISFLLQLKNSLKVYCLIIEVKVFIYFYLIYSYKLTNSSKIQCIQYVQFLSLQISELSYRIYYLVTKDMFYMNILNTE